MADFKIISSEFVDSYSVQPLAVSSAPSVSLVNKALPSSEGPRLSLAQRTLEVSKPLPAELSKWMRKNGFSGTDVNESRADGQRPLHAAVALGKYATFMSEAQEARELGRQMIESLLLNGADVDLSGQWGASALEDSMRLWGPSSVFRMLWFIQKPINFAAHQENQKEIAAQQASVREFRQRCLRLTNGDMPITQEIQQQALGQIECGFQREFIKNVLNLQ